MRIVGNSLNGCWPRDLVQEANVEHLQQIDLAVAYVTKMDEILSLANQRQVPLNLYTLADGHGFPALDVAQKFIGGSRTSWRMFLTRDFYHPKVMWFRGVGAYVGSANLSDKAWFRNHECGIWLSQADLDRLNWSQELAVIFQAVAEHCREATAEDIHALEILRDRRMRLTEEERKFRSDIDRLLGKIPGTHSRADATKRPERGGAARRAFLEEWNDGLTILRKMGDFFDQRRANWPSWVESDAMPSIVQDQATEWWWHTKFRRTGESLRVMAEAHEVNAGKPQAAVEALFEEWAAFSPGKDEVWPYYVNESPRRLNELLRQEEIRSLNEQQLVEVLQLCHAAREHGRQISNEDLELEPGETRQLDQRIELYGRYLWNRRSAMGRTVRDVLEFVLWADPTNPHGSQGAADRIWSAANDSEWKLPHLGVHIFGELIGYARPDEFPPRNNRVSKTLYALGFKVGYA